MISLGPKGDITFKWLCSLDGFSCDAERYYSVPLGEQAQIFGLKKISRVRDYLMNKQQNHGAIFF